MVRAHTYREKLCIDKALHNFFRVYFSLSVYLYVYEFNYIYIYIYIYIYMYGIYNCIYTNIHKMIYV